MSAPTPSHDPKKTRRILSLWFPRLAAERLLRAEPGLAEAPLAVIRETGNIRKVAALSAAAEAQGAARGQPLSEAVTLCPGLITRPADPAGEAAFLSALRRWAGKFSPWVAEDAPEGLMVDLTGCAHLFGGEEALFRTALADCADLGLSVRAGIADTAGAAWALARYAGGGGPAAPRTGDAIDQEARATRSRAQKRHWTRGGVAPAAQVIGGEAARIAPPGATRQALAPLPIAALRVPQETVTGLARLGLRRVGDLWGMPRAGLTRRFGSELVHRLDQALGVAPEPISPARAPLHFALRLSLPDPIGLEADILAGLDRLLPPLCEKLRGAGRGARRVRLELSRVDGGTQVVEVGLARPADHPDRLRPLLAMKLDEVDAGFGIDRLRLVATVTEPLHASQHKGGWAVSAEAHAPRGEAQAMADLIARLGARVGLEAITRERPADSHIPEKTSVTLAAAWSEPAGDWPRPARPRPLTLFRPEPVMAPDCPTPPETFRWRGRTFKMQAASGPERIAPEWWLDEPDWRTGVRDYWRITTAEGAGLWLFYAHGGAASGGWFAQGNFD
ncbi:DNA polymerase Y family protein [Maritalea mobilis]|uniref:Y-family DNA polymerase n=1 Tax=Maritalea mobilis TaxID=483324 RepID=UPI001C97DA70|nr:DNA polymerase Y family protein [Maritalea mobilis]MBY6202879.1 DNA polymerase Y family protein [Maritalea mobilis]